MHSSSCDKILSHPCPPPVRSFYCGVLNTWRPSCPTSQACRKITTWVTTEHKQPSLTPHTSKTAPPFVLRFKKSTPTTGGHSRCSETPPPLKLLLLWVFLSKNPGNALLCPKKKKKHLRGESWARHSPTEVTNQSLSHPHTNHSKRKRYHPPPVFAPPTHSLTQDPTQMNPRSIKANATNKFYRPATTTMQVAYACRSRPRQRRGVWRRPCTRQYVPPPRHYLPPLSCSPEAPRNPTRRRVPHAHSTTVDLPRPPTTATATYSSTTQV